MSASRYTDVVGKKYHSNGQLRLYPGNSVICFVDPSQHEGVHRVCLWAQEQLQSMRCASSFAFLPPESFHMTVFPLLCDQARSPQQWSTLIPTNTPLEEVDRLLAEKLAATPDPPALRMRYGGMWTSSVVAIELKPADAQTREALSLYRDTVSNATGIRAADHETYRFHVSLAYIIRRLSPGESKELTWTLNRVGLELERSFGVFRAGAPQLVYFDDMHRFVPEAQRLDLESRKAAPSESRPERRTSR